MPSLDAVIGSLPESSRASGVRLARLFGAPPSRSTRPWRYVPEEALLPSGAVPGEPEAPSQIATVPASPTVAKDLVGGLAGQAMDVATVVGTAPGILGGVEPPAAVHVEEAAGRVAMDVAVQAALLGGAVAVPALAGAARSALRRPAPPSGRALVRSRAPRAPAPAPAAPVVDELAAMKAAIDKPGPLDPVEPRALVRSRAAEAKAGARETEASASRAGLPVKVTATLPAARVTMRALPAPDRELPELVNRGTQEQRNAIVAEFGLARGATEPQRAARALRAGEESERVWYHGTRGTQASVAGFDPERHASPTALFGPGLYMTDDPYVAAGYAGPFGYVHQVRWRAAPKLLDLEAPLPADAAVALRRAAVDAYQDLARRHPATTKIPPEEVERAVAGKEFDPRQFYGVNRALYDAIKNVAEDQPKAESAYRSVESYIRSTTGEDEFGSGQGKVGVAYFLAKAGYHGLRHVGGRGGARLGPGELEHNVVILFDPEAVGRAVRGPVGAGSEAVLNPAVATVKPPGLKHPKGRPVPPEIDRMRARLPVPAEIEGMDATGVRRSLAALKKLRGEREWTPDVADLFDDVEAALRVRGRDVSEYVRILREVKANPPPTPAEIQAMMDTDALRELERKFERFHEVEAAARVGATKRYGLLKSTFFDLYAAARGRHQELLAEQGLAELVWHIPSVRRATGGRTALPTTDQIDVMTNLFDVEALEQRLYDRLSYSLRFGGYRFHETVQRLYNAAHRRLGELRRGSGSL